MTETSCLNKPFLLLHAMFVCGILWSLFSNGCIAADLRLEEVKRHVEVSAKGVVATITENLYSFDSDSSETSITLNMPFVDNNRIDYDHNCTMECSNKRIYGKKVQAGVLFNSICNAGKIRCLVSVTDRDTELPDIYADEFILTSEDIKHVSCSLHFEEKKVLYWKLDNRGMLETAAPDDNPVEDEDVTWKFSRDTADNTVPLVFLQVTSARTWAVVAGALASLWGKKCDDFSPPSAHDICPVAKNDMEKISGLLDYLKKDFKYIVSRDRGHFLTPASCTETWERRSGDCKDIAVLMVSILNSWGIDAVPALRVREGMDIKKHLPDPFIFDHAVVIANEKWLIDPVTKKVECVDKYGAGRLLKLKSGAGPI